MTHHRHVAALGVSVVCILVLQIHRNLNAQERVFSYAENRVLTQLDPVTYEDNSANDRLAQLLFAQLVQWNNRSEPDSSLIERITRTPRKDEFLITLRQGLLWGNGQPVTAHDLVYTLTTLKNPNTEWNANRRKRKLLSGIAKCTYVDPRTASIIYPGLTEGRTLLSALLIPLLPSQELGSGPLVRRSSFTRNPVGGGPFSFVRWIGEIVEMKRNEHYHRLDRNNPLFLEKVMMVPAPDDRTRIQKLLAGGEAGVDMVVEVPWNEIPTIQSQRGPRGFTLKSIESLSFHYLGCNFRHEVLRIGAVREAISLAIDRVDVVRNSYHKRGDVVSGPFPPGSDYVDKTILPDGYDPGQAERLLDKAGLTDLNGDGLREYKGKPFKLRLVFLSETTSEGALTEEVCTSIQGYLESIGIALEKVKLSSREKFRDKLFRQHDFDLALDSWRFPDVYGNPTSFFFSGDTGRGDEDYNYIGYANPTVDDRILRFRSASDPDTKIFLGRQLHGIIARERPYIFLWSLQSTSAWSNRRLAGVTINPFRFFESIPSWKVVRRP